MATEKADSERQWCPFRPNQAELDRIEAEVAAVTEFQQRLKEHHPDLHCRDRVAHQYQIAGSKVSLEIDTLLPPEIEGIGLFKPGTRHTGVGRVSTGLGTPHIETNPDFLGLMLAFATDSGQRVDFLAINHPASPADNHLDFMDVLGATADAAGEEMPLIGDWGDYDLGDLIAEQTAFAIGLKKRMGWSKAAKTLAHIISQTFRTFRSSTACQSYWTGIVETGPTAAKFTLAPRGADNPRPGFRPGQYHLSEEWRRRQAMTDVTFDLYWIPFLDSDHTPLENLTSPWQEGHKTHVGTVTFPRTGDDEEEENLYAQLAAEMGANPGNWVRNTESSVAIPGTVFTAARQLAYRKSQEGRNALPPDLYQEVFTDGSFSEALIGELTRRRQEKVHLGHRDSAAMPGGDGKHRD